MLSWLLRARVPQQLDEATSTSSSLEQRDVDKVVYLLYADENLAGVFDSIEALETAQVAMALEMDVAWRIRDVCLNAALLLQDAEGS